MKKLIEIGRELHDEHQNALKEYQLTQDKGWRYFREPITADEAFDLAQEAYDNQCNDY